MSNDIIDVLVDIAAPGMKLPRAFALTPENYHSREANNYYWSHSQYKEFVECPARAVAALKGEYIRKPSAALAFGSLLDRALTQPEKLKEFMTGPESFDSDGSSFFFDAKGKPRDNSAMRAYQAVLDRVKNDSVLSDGLTTWKRQAIFVGKIGGVPWKVMLDFWVDTDGSETIIDLKNMASFEDDWATDPVSGKRVKVPWYDAFGYFRQLAVYREIVRQNIGVEPMVALFAFTKQEPPDAVSVAFSSEDALMRMDCELRQISDSMELLDAMKHGRARAVGCEKNECQWCRGQHTCGRTVSAQVNRLWTA